jgi:biotin operon repressor
MPVNGFESYTDMSSSVRKHATRVLDGLRNQPDIKIKSKKIEAILEIKSNEVRAIMHHLRDQGYPICSSSQGYWYTEDPDELDNSINHLTQRANSIAWVANALSRTRDNIKANNNFRSKNGTEREEVQEKLF